MWIMVMTDVETELDIANSARGVVEDVILTHTTAKRYASHHIASSRERRGEGIFVVGDYATQLISDVTLTRFQSSIKDTAHIQHRAS
jgi:hypothetical protein